jgi:acyl carrier protein
MNDKIITTVKDCLGKVLAMEADSIKEDSRLIEDLGADSLDLVELMYLLEQELNVTLEKDDMNLSAQLGLAEDEVHQNEVLTEKALAILRQRHPKESSILVSGVTRRELTNLITVSAIATAIEGKLAGGNDKRVRAC